MVNPPTAHEAIQPGIKSTKRKIVEAAIEFAGGLAGGTASVYIGQPMDTVKVKMQTFPALYKNGFYCFKTTLMRDGIYRGLYAGTVPSLAAQISENSVLFLSYGICQKTLARVTGKHRISDLNVVENSVSGSVAGFFSAFTQCPTELVKCKMQALTEVTQATSRQGAQAVIGGYEGPWAITRHILKEEGLTGMFRGLGPTTVRQMIGYFFFFGGYETSKSLLTPKGKTKDDLGPLETIVCGGIGGMSFWVATYPSDVIKSRVQIGLSGEESGRSFISMLTRIVREEGVRTMYRGLGLTLLRTIPASGGLFLAFEFTKKYLEMLAGHCDLM